jgi:hypothetical protein
MFRPISSTHKRTPRKRVVSRSFRVPPDVDKMLDKEAARRGWTKSFLIKEIIFNWFVYHKALGDRTSAPEDRSSQPTPSPTDTSDAH